MNCQVIYFSGNKQFFSVLSAVVVMVKSVVLDIA